MFTSLPGNVSSRLRVVFLTFDVVLACAASVLFIDLDLARYMVANRDVFTEFAIKAIPDMGSSAAIISIVVPIATLTIVKAAAINSELEKAANTHVRGMPVPLAIESPRTAGR